MREFLLALISGWCICTDPIKVPDSPHRYRPRLRSSGSLDNSIYQDSYGLQDAAVELENLADILATNPVSHSLSQSVGNIFDRVCDSLVSHPDLHQDASATEQLILARLDYSKSGRMTEAARFPLFVQQLRELANRIRLTDNEELVDASEWEDTQNTECESSVTTDSYEDLMFDMDDQNS
jgi:hypothetical protein